MKENRDNNIIDFILHDIKSPLSNITGYTKLLLSNVVGEINPEQRDYLSRIKRNSYRITLYIDDVADTARILYQEKEIPLVRVELSQVLKPAVDRNEVVLNDYKSGFVIMGISEGVYVNSDSERLSRTLDVLISNLTKDINKRRILLTTKQDKDRIMIILSHIAESTSNIDTLLGRFEPAKREHLLQHAATSTVIVKAIGGEIEMYTSNISERMFILTFPIAR